jgi:gluconate:H+ symporter, GntP family
MGTFLIVLLVSLLLLIFMILKLKVHPVLAMFIVAIGMGVGFGNTLLDTMGLINEGFGTTLTGIGITIILGAILAMGIQDIRATDAISHFFNKLFKGKNLELAPALTGFFVSIPVFSDVTMILLAPVASKIAYLKKISMSTMTAFTGLGLVLTHGLVPPTPGILATAITLKAELGFVVFWGLIVSLISFFGTWLLLRKWTEKEFIAPLDKFLGKGESTDYNPEVAATLETSAATSKNELKASTPSFFLAFLPVLLPVLFIASASFANALLEEGTWLHTLLVTLGDKTVALFSGVLVVMFLGFMYKQNVYSSSMKESNGEINQSTPFLYILVETWVTRALIVGILPLLITAMSGAMGNIIKTNEMVDKLATSVASTNILPIFLPYLIALVLMSAVGSMTMSALTTAAIVVPMMPLLGISPVAATLSIGAGTLAISHLNNSGFWILIKFFNLTTKQGFKYITVPTLIASIIAIITITIINSFGLI